MTRKRFGEALLASFLFFIPGLASGITTTITENSLQFSAGPRVLASCGASTGAPWGRHAYSTVTFRANASGSHHFVTTALTGLDNKNILFLYQGAFNPASPSTGQLACHDGGVTFSVTGPAPVPADLVGLTPVKATDGVAFNALLEAPLRISSGIDSANDACAALPAGTFAGAIAVIRRGNCNFSVKVNNASAAGAIAVIIAMNTPSATPITATVPGTTIPAFTVTEAQGDALRDFGQANPATATARLVEGISSNLAASAVYSLVVTGQSPIDSCGEPSLVPANVAASSGIAETLSLGAYHSCATFQGGATQCWGTNADGQLGDESVGLARSPAAVPGLSSGVTAIAAGYAHTCARLTGGAVKCWGANGSGRVGDNSTATRLAPVDVAGLSSGVVTLAAGGAHTCALLTGGAVKCWGANDWGQLGDNSTITRLAPVDVDGLASGVTAIAAGYDHTCALLTGGAVKCWGRNTSGQVGDNSTATRLGPVDVSGLSSGVVTLAAGGAHTCALLTGGTVQCWGRNTSGQVGDNSTTTRLTPVDVAGLSSGVTAIAAGYDHTCARLSGGALKCWGLNQYGQLGDASAGTCPVSRWTGTASLLLAPQVTGLLTVSGTVIGMGAGKNVVLQNNGGDDLTVSANGPFAFATPLTAGGMYAVTVKTRPSGQVCTVANGSGAISANVINVAISCADATPPGPPAGVVATRGNASVSVAFAAPASDGGAAISGYTATCASSNGGTAGFGSGASSPISVGGLTNGKTYTCTVAATNGAGEGSSSDPSNAVVPATVPGAPTGVTATRGNASVSVAFTAPASDGGAAISGYTATCTSSDGGTSGSGTGAASPVLVTGLTNGKAYTCAVKATNSVGDGAASTASSAVAPATVPGAPTGVVVTPGNGQAIVSFVSPVPAAVVRTDGGSPITGFTATCTSSNGGVTGSASGAASPITVTGLTSGKTYTCTVKAANGVGQSEASSASSAFLAATAPLAPTGVTVLAGEGSASVSFVAPASDGGAAISGYTAVCTSSDGGTPRTATRTASPITVTGLTNAKTYTCTVTATNAAGESPASAASSAFSPQPPQPIPTLSEWMLMLMAALVGIAGHRRLRRRVF